MPFESCRRLACFDSDDFSCTNHRSILLILLPTLPIHLRVSIRINTITSNGQPLPILRQLSLRPPPILRLFATLIALPISLPALRLEVLKLHSSMRVRAFIHRTPFPLRPSRTRRRRRSLVFLPITIHPPRQPNSPPQLSRNRARIFHLIRRHLFPSLFLRSFVPALDKSGLGYEE